MGSVFSQEEKKELSPYLQGTDPATFATVIWDCIKEEGMESDEGDLGIYFPPRTANEDSVSEMAYWDGEETTWLPKNIFFEILKMCGEMVIKTFEDNYNLEKSNEYGKSITTLKTALKHLEQHLMKMKNKVSVEEYRKYIDSEFAHEEEEEKQQQEQEDSESDDELPQVTTVDIEKVPTPITIPTVTCTADEDADHSDCSEEPSSPPPAYLLERRRSTKGMEGVMDRLPELWRRVGESSDEPETPTTPPISPRAIDKVKKKVKLLSLFHVQKDEASSEEKESPDEKRPLSAKKNRSSSVENFYKSHKPPSHQLSLPGNISSLGPESSPLPLLPGSIQDPSIKSPDSNSQVSPTKFYLGGLEIDNITSSKAPTPPEGNELPDATPPTLPDVKSNSPTRVSDTLGDGHIAWANSLDSTSSTSTLTPGMGPQPNPELEGSTITTPFLPGSVDN
jgi:hypothetical protein